MHHVRGTNEKNLVISIDKAVAFVIVEYPFRVKVRQLSNRSELNLIKEYLKNPTEDAIGGSMMLNAFSQKSRVRPEGLHSPLGCIIVYASVT